MNYFPEYNKLEEMRKNCWTTEDARNIEKEEAYLIYKGEAYRDYETGQLIYSPREMGN